MIPSTLGAAAIYLLPVMVLVIVRSRRDRSVWEIAGDLPLAVSMDLLAVLLLSRVTTLEWAAVASRPLWLVGGGLAFWWRQRRGERPAWPEVLNRQTLLPVVALALLALALSLQLSRPCAIWDREWHIPLVTSLRGQRLPFMNVYEPQGGLYYHFSGNVLAVMLQVFSGNALHASLALSLAHDLMFALLGGFLGLVLAGLGVQRFLVSATVLVATVWTGPVTLMREPARKLISGYSLVNFLSLSFRPHVALAYLLTLGFASIVLVGVLRSRTTVDRRRLLPALFAMTAALSVTDEASLVLCGLALGVVWLVDPEAVAATRRRGLMILLGLAAAIGLTLLLFEGALGINAPRYPMELVAPRSPGFLAPPIPLSTASGLLLFIQDLLPVLGVLTAAGLLAVRPGGRELRALAAFIGTASLIAMVAFSCLDFNRQSIESHRWVTAPFVLGPLLAVALLVQTQRLTGAPSIAPGLPAFLILVCCGLGVASTTEWVASGLAYRECTRHRNFQGIAADEFYDVDCRETAGARLGEKTTVTYAEARGLYLYTGCRPTFISGRPLPNGHKIKVGHPAYERAALQDLHGNMLPEGGPLSVACVSTPVATDTVCVKARATGTCAKTGSTFDVCALTSAQRAAGLAPPQ